MKKEITKILPYGDTFGDGKIQLSFTLPISSGEIALEAAKEVAKSLGLIQVEVVSMNAIDPKFTFFVVYGSTLIPVDMNAIKIETIQTTAMSMEEIETRIEREIGREIVVVGASTGTDAHTVGIDAIMNMKGIAGHYGLERYRGIRAYNMGSQVENEVFIEMAKKVNADVLLVSQTVTQKDAHVKNLVHLVELLEAEGIRDSVVLIVGGARITNELAKELGYDAGFGTGKYAEDVASFFVEELSKRKKQEKNHE